MKRRKNALPSWEFALCHQLPYVTPFLNKTNLSKSFCLLRSGFQRPIYDKRAMYLFNLEHILLLVLLFLMLNLNQVYVGYSCLLQFLL